MIYLYTYFLSLGWRFYSSSVFHTIMKFTPMPAGAVCYVWQFVFTKQGIKRVWIMEKGLTSWHKGTETVVLYTAVLRLADSHHNALTRDLMRGLWGTYYRLEIALPACSPTSVILFVYALALNTGNSKEYSSINPQDRESAKVYGVGQFHDKNLDWMDFDGAENAENRGQDWAGCDWVWVH